MNKKISFPIAITIIVVLAILVGGLALWQYMCRPVSPPEIYAEIISYIEITEVDRKIEGPSEPFPPGSRTSYSQQTAKIKFLKVLKGPKELEGKTGEIIKKKTYFYFTAEEKLVVYLEKKGDKYYTVGESSNEWRLPSALANINKIQKDSQSGIVVGVLNNPGIKDLRVHILNGKYKAPVLLNDEDWKKNIVKEEKIGEFGIAEIFLEPGNYTILLEFEGKLYSFNRLVNGYYPYIILEKEGDWRAIYFDIDEIAELEEISKERALELANQTLQEKCGVTFYNIERVDWSLEGPASDISAPV